MSPSDFKKAFRLWKHFKTQTVAYRELAAKWHLSVTDLNVKCSHANSLEFQRRHHP